MRRLKGGVPGEVMSGGTRHPQPRRLGWRGSPARTVDRCDHRGGDGPKDNQPGGTFRLVANLARAVPARRARTGAAHLRMACGHDKAGQQGSPALAQEFLHPAASSLSAFCPRPSRPQERGLRRQVSGQLRRTGAAEASSGATTTAVP
jgi:hypothetical protein